MRSQSEAILSHLKTHPDGLTPLDALQMFGCMRLAARIRDLRKAGNMIIGTIEESDSGARYSRYRLMQNGGI